MTHRTDPARRPAGGPIVVRPARVVPNRVAAESLIVASTSTLIVVSLALTVLTAVGAAQTLPSGMRAAVVCAVGLTLPGLPIAGLLRLPFNGIFASVVIAVSISANTLLAQLNFGSGIRQPFIIHAVMLAIAAVALCCFVVRWRSDAPAVRSWGELVSAKLRNPITPARRPSIALLTASAVVFGVAVTRLDTRAAGALGVLQALGLDYLFGLLILCTVLAIEYRRPTLDRAMIAIANVVLIVYVTMPVAWADRTAPFSTAYVHAFITNWMVELGTLPPPLDARVSWAGFFSTIAQFMTIGGVQDSDVFIVDASLIFGVLLVFPVYAIGHALGGNPRGAWLGVTVYVLFNWYQQDYFAPQAVAMQLYATVLAVLLWQMKFAAVPNLSGPSWKQFFTAWMRIPGRVAHRTSGWTVGMEMVLVVVIAALVVTHQLTPVAMIAALVLFTLMGLTRHKVLWLAAVLIFVAWFTYGAHDFWQGHLGDIITDIGGVDQNLNASVAARPAGDPVYGRMQYLRIAASVLIVATAAVGLLKMPRGSQKPLLLALAVAPFSIVLVQSYGGEVAIRSFLYASPVLAPLAALVALPLLGVVERQWIAGVATAVAFFTLAVWVTTDRGLNTSFEHTTPEEVAVSRALLDHVDADRLAYWGQGAMYGLSKSFELSPTCLDSSAALAECASPSYVDYVVDSDQDEKYLQYQSGVDPGMIRQAMDILLSDKGFEMMYDGRDIRVLKRDGAPTIDLGDER